MKDAAPNSILKRIKQELAKTNTCLVAVSKTKTKEEILAIYQEGQRIFAENRVQELVEKQAELPKDIQWHLIGHLQKNKVKYIAPFVGLIHSVDSLPLLVEINKQAKKQKRIINCLLQFKIATEATKFGMTLAEGTALLEAPIFSTLEHIQIKGVMGMASFSNDDAQIREEFERLKRYFSYLQSHHFKDISSFKEISMGMSSDYRIAVEEGSTMVRIGSLLFGQRVY